MLLSSKDKLRFAQQITSIILTFLESKCNAQQKTQKATNSTNQK